MGKLFFGYMALVGFAIGAILVAYPRVQVFFIKPYFWVLIAVFYSTAELTSSDATLQARCWQCRRGCSAS